MNPTQFHVIAVAAIAAAINPLFNQKQVIIPAKGADLTDGTETTAATAETASAVDAAQTREVLIKGLNPGGWFDCEARDHRGVMLRLPVIEEYVGLIFERLGIYATRAAGPGGN